MFRIRDLFYTDPDPRDPYHWFPESGSGSCSTSTLVFKGNKKSLYKSRFFLIFFLLLDRRIRIRTNNYGSGSGTLTESTLLQSDMSTEGGGEEGEMHNWSARVWRWCESPCCDDISLCWDVMTRQRYPPPPLSNWGERGGGLSDSAKTTS